MTSASKPAVDLWITQAGYPQLHSRHISHSKEISQMFYEASGVSTAPRTDRLASRQNGPDLLRQATSHDTFSARRFCAGAGLGSEQERSGQIMSYINRTG
jgi:hypothetical protein